MYREIKRRNFALVTSLTINFKKKKNIINHQFSKKKHKIKGGAFNFKDGIVNYRRQQHYSKNRSIRTLKRNLKLAESLL